ncbi:MAG TPA: polymer-forming cytoskeletal protein [bacterium]|nr:polymer-forming cytoskeletal protein [bacterium]
MGLFDFIKRKKSSEPPQPATEPTAARNKLPIGFYVSPDDEIAGEVKGNVNVLVQGTFEGEIDISGLVWVAEGAKLAGVVRCDDVRLEGHVVGMFHVNGVADIGPVARCDAELVAGRVWRDGSFTQPSPAGTAAPVHPA